MAVAHFAVPLLDLLERSHGTLLTTRYNTIRMHIVRLDDARLRSAILADLDRIYNQRGGGHAPDGGGEN